MQLSRIPMLFLLPVFLLIFTSCNGDYNRTVTDETDLDEDVEKMPEGQFVEKEAMLSLAAEEASHSLMEVKLAQRVISKTDNQGVESLAEMIRRDHKKAREQLEELAEEKDWNLPDDLMDKHRQKLDKLRETPDAEVDQQYVNMMIEGHRKHVNKVRGLLGQKESQGKGQGETQTKETDTLADRSDSPTDDKGFSTYHDTSRKAGADDGQVAYGATEIDPELKMWLANQLPVLEKHLEESKKQRERF